MPRSLNIDPAKKLVVVTYSAVVTDEDLRDCLQALQQAKFPPEFRELADLREVTRFDASPATLRIVASRGECFSPTSVRVILAPSVEAFGIGRMVQTYAEVNHSTPFAVVHTQEEAEQILGVTLS